MKVTASLYSDRSRRFVAVNIAIATVKKFGKRSTITYGEDEIEITFDGETQTYKTQHGEEASNNKTAAIGCAIMAIIIVVIALIVTIGGNSCSSKSSYSKSDAEFLDSISTPGTSEYKWYHDEYLPNTPGTPEYERNRNK